MSSPPARKARLASQYISYLSFSDNQLAQPAGRVVRSVEYAAPAGLTVGPVTSTTGRKATQHNTMARSPSGRPVGLWFSFTGIAKLSGVKDRLLSRFLFTSNPDRNAYVIPCGDCSGRKSGLTKNKKMPGVTSEQLLRVRCDRGPR